MIVCDSCTKKIVGKAINCEKCSPDEYESEVHYCSKCVKRYKSGEYGDYESACPKHYEAIKAEKNNKAIINGYVIKFWDDVGIRITKEGSLSYSANLYGLELNIKCEVIFSAGAIESITHRMTGLRHKEFIVEASIFDHSGAVNKVQDMITTTLRGKIGAFRSAKTAAINKQKEIIKTYDEKISDAQSLIKRWSKSNGNGIAVQEQGTLVKQ